MDLTFDVIALLFLASFVAGTIDSIAGGGGLITIPALLAAGVPPTLTLGTNKLQSCGGSFASSFYFVRKKAVNLKEIRFLILMTFIGATLGTIFVQLINVDDLKIILPFLVLIIGIYFLLSPQLGDEDSKQRISYLLFGCTAAVSIGFYDGMFGPATGSFLTLAFTVLLGFNLTKSVAHARVLNFTSNIAALIFFALGGAIIWKIGFIMMIAQFLGGNVGARLVVTKGKKIIKPIIVTMSLIMTFKMLMDQGYF
ncbi:TSUP family transporter [Otariodibacter oris]|uniref:TSUP family transporter n=1 Tax=Otariodibacter oris TaxID=1032623 RepID=UPI000EADF15D|nr:TSUP family transporter [Otariodibacter oris]QGM81684.1 hypothetical protein A6A10_04905 [Otariodibacter oris]